MSNININVDIFSSGGIASARKSLERLIDRVQKMETELPKALAEYGMNAATVRFSSAVYDILLSGAWSTPDIRVSAEQTADGWAVVANGREVCFIEFGAGVYYNGGNSSYLGERPKEIVGIGEYGQGKGKRDMWVFYDESDDKAWTHGTPANNVLYYTAQDMKARIEEEARRILTS